MRKRTRMCGLCSHTTPDGNSYMGQEEILRKKFNKGNITKEELRAYCFMSKGSHYKEITVNGELQFDLPKNSGGFITVNILGRDMKLTIEEYNTHYLKCGFND